MKRIAYIGLGVMGGGIVETLLKAGYELTIWSRNPDQGKPLVERGAKAAPIIAAAVKGAEVVMYCLSDDRAIDEVVFGPGGVLSSVSAGKIVLDNSTVHPETSRRQAEAYAMKGVEFLDTPVFGSRNEAASGGLWVLAGGKSDVFERVRPILDAIGESVHYMGDCGKGAAMKLVGNLIVASQLEALGEAMVLATKAGLNPEDVLGVLEVADFRSPILSGVGAALVKRDFSTNFALKHMLKDADLIDRFAQDLNSPIPAVAAIRETIKSAVNQGWGEENASAMIKALELQGNARIGQS
ncbi:MAG TPA: NAD(P)-dependent oxidoreductase [Tepidisphaeraceae bacterium]|nr:NAD(P)-dependent oxidoreductase [Tepidisphaeraceae bacterium]